VQPDFIGPFFDFAFQKRVDHVEPMKPRVVEQPLAEAVPNYCKPLRRGVSSVVKKNIATEKHRGIEDAYRLYSRGSGNACKSRPAKMLWNSCSSAS